MSKLHARRVPFGGTSCQTLPHSLQTRCSKSQYSFIRSRSRREPSRSGTLGPYPRWQGGHRLRSWLERILTAKLQYFSWIGPCFIARGVSRFGPALGWQAEGPRFESASALLSFPKVWSVETQSHVTLSLTINETLKWLSSLSIKLIQDWVILVVTV